MMENRQEEDTDLSHGRGIPAECLVLDAAYRTSGLTASDLAVATGISVGSVRIALSGRRYRTGKSEVVAPPDQTLAKLATVLGIAPRQISELGRDRAARLMTDTPTAPAPQDVGAAMVASRTTLARKVLEAFSNAELQAELDRRRREDAELREREAQELQDREDLRDLDDARQADQWPL